MTQGKDKGVESTDSSVPAETPMELEMRILRQTVADMNRNMQDMRANQEHTAKLIQEQTASLKQQQQEPAQSVKSPEQRYEPETPAQERIRKGKMPKNKRTQRNHRRDLHLQKGLHQGFVLRPKVHDPRCIPEGGIARRFRVKGESKDRF